MEIPRHWRLKAQRYRLEGSICSICGQHTFPPRPVCLHCTAQRARMASWGFPVLLTLIGKTEIESHIRCQITERIIGFK